MEGDTEVDPWYVFSHLISRLIDETDWFNYTIYVIKYINEP
jgi:hypothetical protein